MHFETMRVRTLFQTALHGQSQEFPDLVFYIFSIWRTAGILEIQRSTRISIRFLLYTNLAQNTIVYKESKVLSS